MPPDLEAQIAQWRTYVAGHRAVDHTDVDELESHLRDQVTELVESGLTGDEAFLVAVKRMGNLDELSREFAREHSDRLWKQLVLAPTTTQSKGRTARNDFVVMLGLAVLAALAVQAPRLFGLDPMDMTSGFYIRNIGFLVLPMVAGYFAWTRHVGPGRLAMLAAPFLAGVIFANVYPFTRSGSTEVLTGIHLIVALWLAVGVAYLGGEWRSEGTRMDFVRFTGEWFIYYVLIALGGGVLALFTVGTFSAIGIDAGPFISSWLLPSGATGAVVVAAWLVEAKQSVIENMAPVLTRVFTPLFALMLVASVVAAIWTGHGVDVGRDVLILFDLLLVVVLGLFLYSISARDPQDAPATPDILQLVLVASALVLDALALGAIVGRISDFGFSANRTAGLGLNLVLLVNLAWSAWLSLGFLRGRRPFADLERWQTAYIPVYVAWAALVVIVFPPVFGFA
jgi:hypothetical protein